VYKAEPSPSPPGGCGWSHDVPVEVRRISPDGRIHAPFGYRLHVAYRHVWRDTRRLCDELACEVCMHSCSCRACVCNCRRCTE